MNPHPPYIVATAELMRPSPTAVPLPILTPANIDGSDMMTLSDAKMSMLLDQGFTKGLIETLIRSVKDFPLRIWVVDNSGSMQASDGRRIIPTKSRNDVRFVECTRWEEIKDCVKYHMELTALLAAPTSFRFLNHPGYTVGSSQIDIAQMGENFIRQEVSQGINMIDKTQPKGVTPLVPHIQEIAKIIQSLTPQLAAEGKRVSVVIATDGLPTDNQGTHNDSVVRDFVNALKELEGLPVWLVIRLCTNESNIVEFYNNLDEQLEVSVDVLDDYVSEASEIYEHNKWLNYALPIHRMREMGCHDRIFDLLDERPFTIGEIRDFCVLLFGQTNMDGIPDPAVEWSSFLSVLSKIQHREKYQWNPIMKKLTPWIDIKVLHKSYGRGSSNCVIL